MSHGYQGPTFYFQMGNQDQARVNALLDDGVCSGVIMSPRHLQAEKLQKLASNIAGKCSELLIDPQFYNPGFQHKDGYPSLSPVSVADVAALRENPDTLRRILDFQLVAGVSSVVLPMPFIDALNTDWITYLKRSAIDARSYVAERGFRGQVIATLALDHRLVEGTQARTGILDRLTGAEVDGFYIVTSAADDSFLPTRTEYLQGQMDLIFRLKQNRYRLILGYTSYSAALLFPFGVDAFCSGGPKNRRVFKPEEWLRDDEDDDGSHPNAPLPRYASLELLGTIVFPDDADLLFDKGFWSSLDKSPFSASLFDNSVPSTKRETWKQRASYLHYLWTCNQLAAKYAPLDREGRITMTRTILRDAIKRHDAVRQAGIRLRSESQGKHLPVWALCFEEYLRNVEEELSEEYK